MGIHSFMRDLREGLFNLLRPLFLLSWPVLLIGLTYPACSLAADHEGEVVQRIRFLGNGSFSGDELLKWMYLQPARLFRKEEYFPPLLQDDLQRLEDFYRGEGFLQAEVDGGVDPDWAGTRGVGLIIRIREGDRWHISARHLLLSEGGGAALADSLQQVLRLGTGDPYRPRLLSSERDRLVASLASRGFLDAAVRVEVKTYDDCRLAALRYHIVLGPRAVLSDIRIEGLEKTRRYVVEREIDLEPGQLLRPEDAGEVRAALMRTGLFHDVRVVPDPSDWGRRRKSLLIELEENPPGAVGMGFGYGTSDRLRVLTSLEQHNFDGRGIRLELRGVLGERRRALEAETTTPWTLGYRLATSLSSAYEHAKPPSYEAERIRGRIGFKRPLDFFWSVDLGYRVERVELIETRTEANAPEPIRLGTLATGATRDTRDDLDRTTKGSYLRVAQEWSAPWLGSQYHYGRTEFRRLRFHTLGPVTLALRFDAGWLQPQDSDRNIPLSERYFAGGFQTLRGFPEDAVGPKDENGHPRGGRVRLLGSLEFRAPLFWRIAGAVYADAGQLVDHLDALDMRRISVGAGFGLRFRSPVGRLRAGVAFPLTDRDSDGAQFYAGTGAAF